MRLHLPVFMMGMGSIFSGILVHEAYHIFAAKGNAKALCLFFPGINEIPSVSRNGLFGVVGGAGSETIAYGITIIVALVLFLASMFCLGTYFKGAMWGDI